MPITFRGIAATSSRTKINYLLDPGGLKYMLEPIAISTLSTATQGIGSLDAISAKDFFGKG